MDTAGSSSVPNPTKPTYACVRCSDRKVKCNREVPCSACVRHRALCIYRPPKAPRRKKTHAPHDQLVERLRRYEHLLQERGIDPEPPRSIDNPEEIPPIEQGPTPAASAETAGVAQSPMPVSAPSEPRATIFKPEVIQGRSGTRLVDNSLWSRVALEIDENEENVEEDSANDTSDDLPSDDDFGYVLGDKMPNMSPLHPSAEQIYELWGIFLENVNPLSKVIHVPTLQPAIVKAVNNIAQIPRGFEALMFSIYSTAILTLTDNDCVSRFSEPRSILLRRYISATKIALSRAKFMSSNSIVIMQALLFHLLSLRDHSEPRAVWTLTGVAVRIGQGMGMRIDGTLLGLSPFETELRRRIWWQLNMHEFRAAELCGQAKYRDFKLDETTPKIGANVNDCDMHPSMTSAPVESGKITEMLWCSFRTDLATGGAAQQERLRNAGKVGFTSEEFIAMDDLTIKDRFLQEMEEKVETKYLRFCDPSEPLQFMTLVGGRLALNLARFLTHHPRRWAQQSHVPDEEKKLVWDVVMQLLQQYDMMQSSPQLQRFAWNVPYFIQWHAVIHAMDLLRAEPLYPDATKAWRLIEALYRNNAEMLLVTDRPILLAVGNLCLKAYDARETVLSRDGRKEQVPEYIMKLRERARARKEALLERRARKTNVNVPPLHSHIEGPTSTLPSDRLLSQQFATHDHLAMPPSDDTFWLSDALVSDTFTIGAVDPMDLDTQDYDFGGSGGDAVDWAQLDAWFGDPVLANLGGR
ncbi:hypothetical protein K491DRAFT_598281 [Lophiostoma macrostomum CBS 122681]|uniref:Zn(2)-C6 fungal-type domain-containing protein n=1 Tax=Lophiostoma macrostomum CBS 122681 TaxID=1314788 RepID=A0A6A6T9A9_9PLEO|nr:hypothetical protein K491DRAFT_598281 [Lophiostoma macrostomum CBS 122681]